MRLHFSQSVVNCPSSWHHLVQPCRGGYLYNVREVGEMISIAYCTTSRPGGTLCVSSDISTDGPGILFPEVIGNSATCLPARTSSTHRVLTRCRTNPLENQLLIYGSSVGTVVQQYRHVLTTCSFVHCPVVCIGGTS